jgi:hypothetical protein
MGMLSLVRVGGVALAATLLSALGYCQANSQLANNLQPCMRFGADSNRICKVEYQDLPVLINLSWAESSKDHVQG